jgi:hypothetical protein
MKNKQGRILTVLLALFIGAATGSFAQKNNDAGDQDYKTGIGVRLGGLTSGLTIKHFVNPTAAIEGILGFGYRSFVITGLYEKHNDISTAPGLKWLYGLGAHLGFFRYGGYYYRVKYNYGNGNKGYVYYVEDPDNTAAVAGVDFILGMDYKFKNAPFNIGLDIKPFFDFYNGPYGYFDGALSIRFAF